MGKNKTKEENKIKSIIKFDFWEWERIKQKKKLCKRDWHTFSASHYNIRHLKLKINKK